MPRKRLTKQPLPSPFCTSIENLPRLYIIICIFMHLIYKFFTLIYQTTMITLFYFITYTQYYNAIIKIT